MLYCKHIIANIVKGMYRNSWTGQLHNDDNNNDQKKKQKKMMMEKGTERKRKTQRRRKRGRNGRDEEGKNRIYHQPDAWTHNLSLEWNGSLHGERES